MRAWLVNFGVMLALVGCGGGGGGSSPAITSPAPAGQVITGPEIAGPNVLHVTLDRGIDGSALNAPFVTVTVCQPGTSTCVDIDHVLVDTGSVGLRIASSALPPAVALPMVVNAGAPAGECARFSSGFAWGSLRQADVRLGGQTAPDLTIQLVDDRAAPFDTVPTACLGLGKSIGAGRGARGILGVGLTDRDCGNACEVSPAGQIYFTCGGSRCTPSTLPAAVQVRNPVAALPTDNNGVVLSLPTVPAGGAAGATGSLVLGIGTQANNQLGSATVYATDADGFFTTTYNGREYRSSFLDSGSNGLFFSDHSLSMCGSFFCPGRTLALLATNTSATGVSGAVNFTIDSVDKLVNSVAVANVGGDEGLPATFDWGLPFFLGRTVYVARAGAQTPAGRGPYWAY